MNQMQREIQQMLIYTQSIGVRNTHFSSLLGVHSSHINKMKAGNFETLSFEKQAQLHKILQQYTGVEKGK
jgi:hypothetical protein